MRPISMYAAFAVLLWYSGNAEAQPLHAYEPYCSSRMGLEAAKSDAPALLALKLKGLLNEAEECECRVNCTSSYLLEGRRTCYRLVDQCRSNCNDVACDQNETCADTEIVGSGQETVASCRYVDQTACNCCIRNACYYSQVCQNECYNSTCGQVCELGYSSCGYSWCDWMDPLVNKMPYTEVQQQIVQDWILVYLNMFFTNPCVPVKIAATINSVANEIFTNRCQDISLTTQELDDLNQYLEGNMGNPLCE